MQRTASRQRVLRLAARRVWRSSVAVWGAGVLGLMADNDAGGMLAYLITGADGHLLLFALALAFLAPASYVVQEMALRIAVSERRPFGQLLRERRGPLVAALHSIALYVLNSLILVTEFGGMARALEIFGVPPAVGLALAVAAVLVLTLLVPYAIVERILLVVSLGGLTFLLAFFELAHGRPLWSELVWAGPPSARTLFLLLALAGNSLAPWMLYWQENAVVAGRPQRLGEGRLDLRWGVLGQSAFAVMAMASGGLLHLSPGGLSHPLAFLRHNGPRSAAVLLSLGVADAGLLAAVTISLTSVWMLEEGLGWEAALIQGARPTGRGLLVHLATLFGAALVVLVPGFAMGDVAVWAQVASGVYLPVTLVLFLSFARDRSLLGNHALSPRRARWLTVVLVGFSCIVAAGIVASFV